MKKETYYCDRCEEEVNFEDKSIVEISASKPGRYSANNHFRIRLDLCPACFGRLGIEFDKENLVLNSKSILLKGKENE